MKGAAPLSHLRITALKGFRDVEIELGPLTILTGANSVGKSTVLQAFLLMAAASRATTAEAPLPTRASAGRVRGGYVPLNRPPLALGTWGQAVNDASGSNAKIRIVATWMDGEAGAVLLAAAPAGRPGHAAVEPPDIEDGATGRPPFGRPPVWLPAERVGPRVLHSLWGEDDPQVQDGQDVARRFESLPSPKKVEVERWLDRVAHDTPEGGNPRLRVEAKAIKDLGLVELTFSLWNPAEGLWDSPRLPTQVGFGLSYALPVVVAAVAAEPGDLLLVENPESHLHPRAQRHLTGMLAEAAARGVQVVVETHSDHIVNGARLAVKQGVLEPDSLVLQHISGGMGDAGPTVVRPRCDANGFLDHWPDGFFDEWDRTLRELHPTGS